MADITWQEYRDGIGQPDKPLFNDLADKVADSLCDIWQSEPGQMYGQWMGYAGQAMMGGLMDTMCRPRNKVPPPPPSPGLRGGQCKCVAYDVTYQVSTNNVPGAPNTYYGVIGPINGPMSRRTAGGGLEVGIESSSEDCKTRVWAAMIATSRPDVDDISAQIISVVPSAGGADECGDALPVYQAGPIIPSPRLPPVSIPVGDGPNINVAPVIIPVTIKPEFNFRPEINIGVGPINFNFNPGGIDINLPPGSQLPQQPDEEPPSYPSLPPGSPDAVEPDAGGDCPDYSDRFDSIDDDLADIKRQLDDIEECACKEEKKYTYQPVALIAGDSGCVSLPENTVAVSAVVTTSLSAPKKEPGKEGPDVLYAGWGWFGYTGGQGERLHMDCPNKVFLAEGERHPEQFCFTCRVGWEAAITAWKKVEIVES